MTSLSAYIDESGVGEDPSSKSTVGFIVAAGGFIATDQDWVQLVTEWNEVLTSHEVSPPILHMKHLLHGRGAYIGWGSDQKRDLLAELIDVVGNSPIVGNAFVIERGHPQDWCSPELAAPSARRESYLASAYIHNIVSIAHAAEMFVGCDREISFVCGNNEQAGLLTKLFCRLRLESGVRGSQRLGTITFDSPQRAVPLQTADMLVYEARRAAIDETLNRPKRTSFRRLHDLGRITFERITLEWASTIWQDLVRSVTPESLERERQLSRQIDRDISRGQRRR